MLKLIKWLINHGWNFNFIEGELRFCYTNRLCLINTEKEAKEIYKELKKDKNYR